MTRARAHRVSPPTSVVLALALAACGAALAVARAPAWASDGGADGPRGSARFDASAGDDARAPDAVAVLMAGADVGARVDAGQGTAAVAPGAGADAGVRADADAGAAQAQAPRGAPARARSPVSRVARVTIGLLLLLALALAAGHPSVRTFERRVGLAMVAATGMPFLALGVVARLPAVDILSDEIVRDLRPVLEFGLGWIGFRIGSEFDVRELDRLPRGTGRLLATESAFACVAAGLGSAAALFMVGVPPGSGLVRDGLILGACAAVSAPSGARALEAAGLLTEGGSRLIRKVSVLDDAAPILVLGLVTALFRPLSAARWQLPTLGWVFVQVGMGAALGMLTVAAVRAARNANEEIALTLGAVAFAAGMAGYLGFSPLAVGCIAGVVVSNLVSRREGALATQLRELERPIYMTFFVVAGAMWDVRDWRGWAIVPLFVVARLFGKLLGARAAYLAERADVRRAAHRVAAAEPAEGSRPSWLPLSELPDARTLGIALVPTGAVSIAVVVSARQSYPLAVEPYLETVVIVGAIAAEVVFQLSVPIARRQSSAPPPPGESGVSSPGPLPVEPSIPESAMRPEPPRAPE